MSFLSAKHVRLIYLYMMMLWTGIPKRHAFDLMKRITDDKLVLSICARCIHPPDYNMSIANKVARLDCDLECLYIDAYNQAATLYAISQGAPHLRCTDGFTRDFLERKFDRQTALELLAQLLHEALAAQRIRVKKLVLLLDSRVPHSGDHASRLRRIFGHMNSSVKVYIAVSRRVDKSLIEASRRRNCVVATSDTAILTRAPRVVDLAGYLASWKGFEVKDIFSVLRQLHQDWCKEGPVAQPG